MVLVLLALFPSYFLSPCRAFSWQPTAAPSTSQSPRHPAVAWGSRRWSCGFWAEPSFRQIENHGPTWGPQDSQVGFLFWGNPGLRGRSWPHARLCPRLWLWPHLPLCPSVLLDVCILLSALRLEQGRCTERAHLTVPFTSPFRDCDPRAGMRNGDILPLCRRQCALCSVFPQKADWEMS